MQGTLLVMKAYSELGERNMVYLKLFGLWRMAAERTFGLLLRS